MRQTNASDDIRFEICYESSFEKAPIGGFPTVMKDRDDTKMLKTGLIGTAVAVVCCFTPLLVVALGAVGLSGLVGWWLDLILFPALGFFLLLTGYAFYRRSKHREAG